VSDAISQSAKESFILVTFTYGDPDDLSYAYYTNRSESYGIYAPMPAIEVELPPNTGVFGDDLCTIRMASDAFSDRLTDGMPTSRTQVQVEEITLSLEIGGAALRKLLFRGQVTSTIRNYQGRAGSRAIKAKSKKVFLNVKMGLQIDHQCPFIFNGLGCNSGTFAGGAPLHSNAGGGTILSIEGHKITMTAPLTAAINNLYRKGYVTLDGINIDVRDFDASIDASVLYLTRQPPTYWVGKVIQVFPGCDKTISNCRDQVNEPNFGGVGYGMPAYNPNFESAP
jgi:hypothetical protein